MKRDKIDRRGVRETQDQDVRPEGPRAGGGESLLEGASEGAASARGAWSVIPGAEAETQREDAARSVATP